MAGVLSRMCPRVTRVPMTVACDDDVRAFVKACVPALREVPAAEVEVSLLAGGLTNILYRASHAPSNVHSVVRQFGEGTDAFIDRDAEEFWIAAFMTVHGRCDNGLAYEFLVGYENPSLDDYTEHRLDLAAALARFHHRGATWGRCTPRFANAPNSAKEVFLGTFVEQALGLEDDAKKHLSPERRAVVDRLVSSLPAATDRLRKSIAAIERHLVVGPCHNDANRPNTMKNTATGEIRFIDFEYMQPSFILADLANTMCEFAGFDADWERMLDWDQKKAFLAAYYRESARLCMGEGAAVEGSLDAEVAMMELLEGVSNVGWCAWAVKQAAVSTIDYDFVAYAERRFARYVDKIDEWERNVATHVLTPLAAAGQY